MKASNEKVFHRATIVLALMCTITLTGCPSANSPTKPSMPSTSMPVPSPSTSSGSSSPPSSNAPQNETTIENTSSKRSGSPGSSKSELPGEVQTAENGPGFEPDAFPGSRALPSLIDDEPVIIATNRSLPGEKNTSGANSGLINSESELDPADTGVFNKNEVMGGMTGTRSEDGMETDWGEPGDMTTSEKVAVLDRQLEASTEVFDTIIRDERQQQREIRRSEIPRPSSASSAIEQSGYVLTPSEEVTEEYRGGVSSGGSGGSGGRLQKPAVYKAPQDIPDGNDDDVVARQLREAAMREADPLVRERLWNEYRKYKGLKTPES